MNSNPAAAEGTPPHPRRNSILVYLPGGVPVLRIAVEDLLDSGWDDVFRRRTYEIACAFEGSFRSCGREDLAGIARSILHLLELPREKAGALKTAMKEKLTDLLGLLEALLGSDEETRSA
jgi:hypothetical protein